MSHRSLAVAIIIALTPTVALSQHGMTPELAAGMKQLGSVHISPDGEWVAYTVTVPDLTESSTNADIWLVSTKGGAPVRLTNHKAMDDGAHWAPDSKSIAFISTRDGAPQIYRLSLGGGEPEKLSTTKGGVQSFEWSPDGARIAYVSSRDKTAEEEQKAKEKDDAIVTGRDYLPSRLHVLDVATQKSTEIAKAEAILSISWSPDGSRLAYTVSPSPKPDDFRFTDVMIVDAAGGTPRKLVDNTGPDQEAHWSPDGTWIVYRTKSAKSVSMSQSKLAVIAAVGGTPRILAPEFLYEPGDPVWSADGKSLFFWSSVRTRDELYQIALDGGAPKQLSNLEGTRGLFGGGSPSISSNGQIVAYPRSTLTTPDEVNVSRLGGTWSNTALTSINPQLSKVAMGKGEVVRWKGKDGMDIEGVLILPVGYEQGKRYPTVAIIHGGPSGSWNEAFPANWYNSAQVYAGQGWLAFLPNVRGSSGYGEKFLAANYRDWGNGDFQDIQTGLDALVKRGLADSTKMAQTGWSYGGYMTAWTLTQTNRFKAVMVGAGLTNMYSMYSTNDLQMVLEDYFGGQPWDDEAAYRRASAMMSIKKAKTPTLILHGQADTRVPIGQAQELYMGLKKNNVPVELVFFPREPHGLQEPRHMMDKMKREYAFFSKYVLGVEVQDKVVQ